MSKLETLGIRIIEHKIGEGGSAYVHKAEVVKQIIEGIPDVGTIIAVKEYRESILEVPNQIQRIKQEGEIGKTIDHKNLVKIYCSYIPENPTETHYLFMEWVDGMMLHRWASNLRSNASWTRVQNVCLGIVDGIKALHENEIVHRDIKPENVMVVGDTPKVMDIGIAEITSENEHTLGTRMEDFLGSIRYASPQFLYGETFHQKDDIYSIGATLLETLTGVQPYEDIKRKPILSIAIIQAPPPVGKMRDNVPGHIKILLEGCLHPDRARRPTLNEIEDALKSNIGTVYIKAELRRQTAEKKYYDVLKMDEDSGGFFADVGSDSPETFIEYNVIRRESAINVPSLGTDVEPEIWVATAELRR